MKRRRPAGTGQLYLRGSVWWIKYYNQGKPIRETSESGDREEAERLLKVRLAEVATGKFRGVVPGRITISQICELVLDDYREQSRRSLKDVEARIEKNILPLVGQIRAAEFGSSTLKRYIEKRKSAGAAPATINRELAVLRRGFTLAMRHEPPLIAWAPFFKALPERNVRTGFVQHAQYKVILEALPQRLKPLCVVGYHVGARLGELLSIQWHQVDLDAGEIRLSGNQTKTGEPRTLPIYGDMRAWLQMAKAERDEYWSACPWVFQSKGKRIGRHLAGWREACEIAGVPGLLFHDLRRSAVRNMERAGIPRKVAMSISGHLTESVYQRYNIVSAEDLKVAGRKLDDYLKGLGTIVGTAGKKGAKKGRARLQ